MLKDMIKKLKKDIWVIKDFENNIFFDENMMSLNPFEAVIDPFHRDD